MKNSATTFLIFISSAIRAYDFPRINGFVHTTEFKDVLDHSEKPIGERYVYLGRELTTDEFNEAAAMIFNPAFPGEGRTFQPLALDPEAIVAREEARKLAQEKAQAEADEAQRKAEEAEAQAEADRIAELDAQQARLRQEEADRQLARESMERVKKATQEADRRSAEQAKAAAQTKPPVSKPAPVSKVTPIVAPDPAVENTTTQAATEDETDAQAEEDRADFDAQKAAEEEFARAKEAEEKAADEKEKSTPTGPVFELDGKNIKLDGQRVAGLYAPDNSLRVVAKFADLKPAIEAWLKTQAIA